MIIRTVDDCTRISESSIIRDNINGNEKCINMITYVIAYNKKRIWSYTDIYLKKYLKIKGRYITFIYLKLVDIKHLYDKDWLLFKKYDTILVSLQIISKIINSLNFKNKI